MKKILALALVIVLALSLGAPAFAADSPTGDTPSAAGNAVSARTGNAGDRIYHALLTEHEGIITISSTHESQADDTEITTVPLSDHGDSVVIDYSGYQNSWYNYVEIDDYGNVIIKKTDVKVITVGLAEKDSLTDEWRENLDAAVQAAKEDTSVITYDVFYCRIEDDLLLDEHHAVSFPFACTDSHPQVTMNDKYMQVVEEEYSADTDGKTIEQK